MYFNIFILSVIGLLTLVEAKYKDVPCEWQSLTGSHFDLKPLILPPGLSTPYFIKDGDIPCTPEEEPAYSYVWNFCAEVPYDDVPDACRAKNKTHAVALQYAWYDSWSDCKIVGRYNPDNDDLSYALLDSRDPSLGVSVSYPSGERCASGVLRTTTLDVQCANEKSKIISAQEPQHCQYHFVMESYHGCPTECPITGNGLCNSHGHCAFDQVAKKPYCYCNEGYSGDSCTKTASSSEFNGSTLQMRLVTALVVITALLGVVIAYMIFKVISLRKEQAAETNAFQFTERKNFITKSKYRDSSDF